MSYICVLCASALTSAMTSASPGLHMTSQRRGVMPLVLFWNFSGSISKKSLNLRRERGIAYCKSAQAGGAAGSASTVRLWDRGLVHRAWNLHSNLEDVGVYLGHAVHRMRTHNTQMGHVDPLLSAFLNERHAAQTVIITRIFSSNFLQNEKQQQPKWAHTIVSRCILLAEPLLV